MTFVAPYREHSGRRPFRTPMSLDSANAALTVFVCVTVGVGVFVMALLGAWVGLGLMLIGGGALSISWAMSPCAVVVTEGELRVQRRAWAAARVALASVDSVERADRLGCRMLRLFGVGGFFGSYGLFWSDALGQFRLYATRRGQVVVVRRRGRALPIVITPDDVGGVITAITEQR